MLFHIEPSRNDSVTVFTPIMLENVAAGSMSFEEAFKSKTRDDKGKVKPDGGLFPPSQKGAVRAMDDVDIALSQGAKRNNAGAINQTQRQLEFVKIWIQNRLINKENYLDLVSMEEKITVYIREDFEKELKAFLKLKD